MSTEQQYRVTGKSGPGVDWRSLPGDTMVRYWCFDSVDPPRPLCLIEPHPGEWDAGRYEILEAISPPQADPVECHPWCGGEYSKSCVPGKIANYLPHANSRLESMCWRGFDSSGHPTGPAYCTQACLDRAKSAKAPECIRSTCKAPPVAGGELCAAHAGQVETVKAKRCAWQVNGVSACGLPSTGGRLCQKHEAELRASDATPNPPPTETRLERWRREHKGYSHGAADPRIHDANVAAMMVGRDGPREPYVPPPKLPPWTPRDLDGDIPDAWEPGGARLRHQMRKDR